MGIITQIKKSLVSDSNNCLHKNIIKVKNIVYPPNINMGDLSLPCFELANILHIRPHEAALELKKLLSKKKNKYLSSIQVTGPYINFIINKKILAKNLLKEIKEKQNKYGKLKVSEKKKIMIEYSNANTHKEYHIGHLRNICIGDSINKILETNGHNIFPVSYINDFGIHVAKTLWCLKEYYKDKIPQKNKGEFLGKIYADSTNKTKENPLAQDLISFLMKRIESREGEDYKLWQKTRNWSIKQFNEIYKELNIEFKNIYYESELIQKGLKIIKELKEKKILIESNGAIIADLNKYNLGILVIMRSDGTALYPVADISLAIQKITKHKLDKSIYVVDVRQSLYFKQLFKLLELMGYKQDLVHLSYEFVKLPDGMMSSRTGNIITYSDLREKLKTKAKEEILKRHNNWSLRKIEKTATTLALAIMKFEMLKVDTNQIINFNFENALKFEGYTAGYLEYTYVRINSILKIFYKENIDTIFSEINLSILNNKKEHELIIKMAKYPEIIKKAGNNYNPSEVAKYLFELAQITNDYYHATPILKSDEELRSARILLIESVNQIIKNGLGLLGIEVLNEM